MSADAAVKKEALDRALSDPDTLLLYYQPIHELESKSIIAVEALVRQRRESGEIREAHAISDGAAHGTAADLVEFDSWSIATAFEAAASWQRNGVAVRLNVNLSPREFQEPDIVSRMKGLIASSGIDGRSINLEITETSVIAHPRQAAEIVSELKGLGPEIWLDDFGSGHSSLTHLLHLPVDGVKIPGCYVGPIEESERARAIVAAVIKLSHELRLRVIAEGIERPGQLEILRGMQCDYIQGFLYSRPMSLSGFRDLALSHGER